MKIAVVIPIYQLNLSTLEYRALKQVYTVLNAYSLIFIKPKSLDLGSIKKDFSSTETVSFADRFFQNKNGYNELMLSASFYKRFRSFDYILIYQLDAYVFRDELFAWCQKGYDYIGAPWLQKRVYQYPVISQIRIAWHRYQLKKGKHSSQSLYNQIGNGGFSLRKVESHYKATIKYRAKIREYLSIKNNHFYNEDVFWATEAPEFRKPSVKEALAFSFDKYPSYCFNLTNGQLPFGCHAWYKFKMRKFWRPIIGF
jgi:hypothetical protein